MHVRKNNNNEYFVGMWGYESYVALNLFFVKNEFVAPSDKITPFVHAISKM